jgi:hypothetical protein
MTEENRKPRPPEEGRREYTFKVLKPGTVALFREDPDEGQRLAMSTGLVKEGRPIQFFEFLKMFAAMLEASGYEDEDTVCLLISVAQVKRAMERTIELTAQAEEERIDTDPSLKPPIELNYSLQGATLRVHAVIPPVVGPVPEIIFSIDLFTKQGVFKDVANMVDEIEAELRLQGIEKPGKISQVRIAQTLVSRWLGKEHLDVDDTAS